MTTEPPDAVNRRSWGDLADAVAAAILYVEGESVETGNRSIGTAFHIGGGWLLTAAHVMVDLRAPAMWLENQDEPRTDEAVATLDVMLDQENDLALVRSSFAGACVPVLTDRDRRPRTQDDVLILGYPRVAGMTDPMLVTDRTYISASPSSRDRFGLYSFLLSIRDRPGFSGGPVLLETGSACGVISAARIDQSPEGVTEFTSAVSYQHVWDLLLGAWCDEEGPHATWIREAVARGATRHQDLVEGR